MKKDQLIMALKNLRSALVEADTYGYYSLDLDTLAQELGIEKEDYDE